MNINKIELQTKLEPKDLLNAMEYLGKSTSSADNIHTYSKSPIHILVHNEILKFSKEEIDSCKETLRFGTDLFNSSFRIKNSYIFSAFLKIGAFQDRISNDTKWLLKQSTNPSNDLYDLMYDVEREHYDNRSGHYQDEYNGGILFNSIFDHYAYNLNAEKFTLVDNYVKTFWKQKETAFINFIYRNHGRRAELCDYLVVKLKSKNVDFSKNNLLNNSLPEEDYWTRDSKSFFISAPDIPKIKKLLDCGYKFDEKNYSHYNNNLFISVFKSKRIDIIETILPHLTDITPKSGTLEEQNAFIESLHSQVGNNLDAQHVKFIESLYNRCLLNIELKYNVNTTKHKVKL